MKWNWILGGSIDATSCPSVAELSVEPGPDVLGGHPGLFPDATQLEFCSRLYGPSANQPPSQRHHRQRHQQLPPVRFDLRRRRRPASSAGEWGPTDVKVINYANKCRYMKPLGMLIFGGRYRKKKNLLLPDWIGVKKCRAAC